MKLTHVKIKKEEDEKGKGETVCNVLVADVDRTTQEKIVTTIMILLKGNIGRHG